MSDLNTNLVSNKKSDNMNPLGRPLTIVFALPGKEYSNKFLLSWTMLFNYCISHQINPLITNHYDKNCYYVRNNCIGGNNIKGKDQKPFGGEIDYDFIMWIDPDKVFTVDNFIDLLKHDKDIVSGIYLMNSRAFNTIEKFDNDYFREHGNYKFLTCEELMKRSEKESEKESNVESVLEVDYTGMGWMLVKKGVFERLEYPWFRPEWSKFEMTDASGNKSEILEFSNEDVSFMNAVKKQNIVIHVDTKVLVGHETELVMG